MVDDCNVADMEDFVASSANQVGKEGEHGEINAKGAATIQPR